MPPTPVLDDATIVARVRNGDAAAFGALYRQHRTAVERIVRIRLGDQGDPAEVVQKVFTVAWRRIDRLRDPDRLRPWLAQIARHAAIDHGRHHRRRLTASGDDVLHRVVDDGPAPDELAEAAELAVPATNRSRHVSTSSAVAARPRKSWWAAYTKQASWVTVPGSGGSSPTAGRATTTSESAATRASRDGSTRERTMPSRRCDPAGVTARFRRRVRNGCALRTLSSFGAP